MLLFLLFLLFVLVAVFVSLSCTLTMEELIDDAVALSFVELVGGFADIKAKFPASETTRRRFVSHFGISSCHCAALWNYLEDTDVTMKYVEMNKSHLLWTLDLLKGDDTEERLAGRWRVDEKTIRKWTGTLLEELSDLKVVSGCCCCC